MKKKLGKQELSKYVDSEEEEYQIEQEEEKVTSAKPYYQSSLVTASNVALNDIELKEF